MANQKMSLRSIALRLIALLLLVQAVMWIDVMPAHAAPPCDFDENVPKTRPNPEAGPTEVRASIFIFDLVDINTVKQEFSLDFFLEAEWKDERLGAMLRKAGVKTCEVPLDAVWQSGMIIVNSRELRSDLPKVLYVHANGTVEGEQRIIGTFSAPMDLADFPLDTQIMPVTFISTKYGPDELKIIFVRGGAEEVLSESGWSVKLARAEAGIYDVELIHTSGEEEAEALARFDYELEVKRETAYYLWKVFLPLCIIVFASWAVFWIDPTQMGVQIGIGTSMMLTIIAFLFSLQNILPKINYLTRMDIFIYSSLIFVFLAFVQGLTTCTIAAHGRELVARRIDRWTRVFIPFAFIAVIVWFWWV